MAWLPVLVLTVLGILSIAFMMQMPKEKPMHNIKRVIRGKPEADVVAPEPESVVEPVVEPVKEYEQPNLPDKTRAIFLFHHAHSHTGGSYVNFIHSTLDQIIMHASDPIYFITNINFKHFGVTVLPELDVHWAGVFKSDSGPWNTGFSRFMNIGEYMNELGISQALQIETDNVILKDIDMEVFDSKYGKNMAATVLGKNMFTASVFWIGSLETLNKMNTWVKDVWTPASVEKRKQLTGDVGYIPTPSERSSEMLALGAYAHDGYLKVLPTFGEDVIFDPGTYGQIFVTKLSPKILQHHWVTHHIQGMTFKDVLPLLFNLHHYQPKTQIPQFVHSIETIDLGIPCVDKDIDDLQKLLDSIQYQTKKPNRVIVSMYTSRNIDCDECLFIRQNKKSNAAGNRNAIIKASNATYITFMDCDDTMHDRRTEIMFDAMQNQDIGWHNYNSKSASVPAEIDYVYDLGIKNGLVNSGFDVAHGHVTIRRGSTLFFDESPAFTRGQDAKFARDMINAGARSVFVNAKLIRYVPRANKKFNDPSSGKTGKEKNVCMSGNAVGRTANKLVSILHALPLDGTLTLDSEWSKIYEKWLEPNNKVILYSKKKCTEKISAWDAFYKFKGGKQGKFPFYRHERPDTKLSLKLDTLNKAKSILSTFAGPVATVHGRWLEGSCLKRANALNNLCTSKNIKWTKPCAYTEDFVRKHTNISNIIYCSDDQRPEYRKTFKHVDKHDFNIQLALMTLSDYHFGNPQSTIDYVLTYVRKKNKMYPEECYSVGPFVKAPPITTIDCKAYKEVDPIHIGFMKSKHPYQVSFSWWDTARHNEITNGKETHSNDSVMTIQKLLAEIPINSVFIDVGANVGFMTFSGAVQGHQTIAIDPISYNIAKICEGKNANVNNGLFKEDMVRVIHAAAGSENKPQINITRPTDDTGYFEQSSLARTAVHKNKITTETIPMVTIDSIINEVRVGMVKIDVQGFEYDVLLGMKKILENNPPKYIFYEEDPRMIREAGFVPGASRKMLELYDYTCQSKGGDILCSYTPTSIKGFVNPFSGGGMSKDEQDFLEQTYRHSTSIFEWGMGSSSALANYVGVNTLVSVDSYLKWVKKTKSVVNNDNYRFQYVNIGDVGAYGVPIGPQSISWLDYSMKVNDETKPFDIYLVDGRFRVACACMALLHGRADSYVMIHDFQREHYQEILQVADKVEQIGILVKLKKKTGTDSALQDMWEKYKYDYR